MERLGVDRAYRGQEHALGGDRRARAIRRRQPVLASAVRGRFRRDHVHAGPPTHAVAALVSLPEDDHLERLGARGGQDVQSTTAASTTPRPPTSTLHIEELITKIPAIKDEQELILAYRELNGLFMQYQPTIPLVYRPDQFYEFSSRHWQDWPTEQNPYLSRHASRRSARHLDAVGTQSPPRKTRSHATQSSHAEACHRAGRLVLRHVSRGGDHQLLPPSPGRRQPHRHASWPRRARGSTASRQRERRRVPERVRPGRARRERQGDARRGGQTNQSARSGRSLATTWA